ncbi:Ig-like domain-containing protein [Neobacillus sp. 179-C4.2 HS]|uniref:Ig-like domain-containing protein n=1 Tax=Neobacillus driksii TaxID=3035913 RepID=A0ABV4YZB2_9BACI
MNGKKIKLFLSLLYLWYILFSVDIRNNQVYASTLNLDHNSGFLLSGYQSNAVLPSTYNWTRQSAYKGSTTFQQKWAFSKGGLYTESSPVIDDQGIIYYGDDEGLHAVKKDGTEKFFFPVKDGLVVNSSPALSSDGSIYIFAGQQDTSGRLLDNIVYAINPDGSLKWQLAVDTRGTYFDSTPAISGEGVIYLVASKNLMAINPDGTKKWNVTFDEDVKSNPVIGVDGTIYLNTQEVNGLKAINPDGTVKWEVACYGAHFAPVITKDGSLYAVGFSDSQTYLYHVQTDGPIIWKSPIDYYPFQGGIALANDGTIYVTTYVPGDVYAFTGDGTRKWKYSAPDRGFFSSPVVDAEGNIFVNYGQGQIYVLGSDGSKKYEYSLGHQAIYTMPVIGDDGTIYVTSDGLYAIGDYDSAVTGISFPSTDYHMLLGEKKKFGIQVEYEDGAKKTLESGFWLSTSELSNYKIINSVELQALGEGTVTITAHYGGKEATAKLTSTAEKSAFNQNYVTGGFSAGLYDRSAVQPTAHNWSRQSRFKGLDKPVIKWKFKVDGSINGDAVIGSDNTVYFTSTNGNLYAMNTDGSCKWVQGLSTTISSAPVIGQNGTIYVSSQDGFVYAFSPDGDELWHYALTGNYQPAVLASPAIGEDGTIYIAASYRFYAISPTGQLKWSMMMPYVSESAPAIAKDGTIYAIYGKQIFALNPKGTKKWSQTMAYSITSSPVVLEDGGIYLGTNGAPEVLTKNGIWDDNKILSGYIKGWVGGAAIRSDGGIYLGNSKGELFYVPKSRYEKDWKFKTEDMIFSTPIIGSDGTVFTNTMYGTIFALNADGTEKWSMDLDEDFKYNSMSLGKDGSLYIGSENGYFYCIGSVIPSPIVNEIGDNQETLEGNASPGVNVIVEINGNVLREGVADNNGKFSILIGKQVAGTTLNVYSSDDFYNKREKINVVVVDNTPPVLNSIDGVTDQSKQVSGTTEANAKVTIKIGVNEYTGTANKNGSFSVVIPLQRAGTQVNVTATDAAGNGSKGTSITVKDVTPPAIQKVNAVSNQSISVTGMTEAKVKVTVKIGSKIYTAIADTKGSFKVTIPKPTAGTKITVTANDTAGNVSAGKTIVVLDKIAPTVPTVNTVSNLSKTVTGKAEAGSTVTVAISAKLYTVKADSKGIFKITIPVQKAGTKLSVTSKDAAGNVSAGKTIVVLDKIAPTVPTVNTVSNLSKTVTGKAEAGSTVTVAISAKLYTAKADSKGIFKITIPVQKAGTKLSVTSKDAAGNVSAGKTIVVLDKIAPTVPTVDKVSNLSKTVTGKAEAESTVTLAIGTKMYTAKADSKGIFKITIPVQKAGTKLSVTSKDAAGNTSGAKSVSVIDKIAPAAPKINTVVKITTTEVLGTAEASTTITVKVGKTEIGTAKADSKGNFKVKIKAQKKDKILTINATDKANNISKSTTVKVK